jgi:hypothetical protein
VHSEFEERTLDENAALGIVNQNRCLAHLPC